MSRWLIKKHVPYEGICETYADSAAEVVQYLSWQSGLDRQDITIEPAGSVSYEPWEFENAYQNGEVV